MAAYPRISVSRINKAISKERNAWLSDAGGWRGFGQLLIRISKRGTGRFYFRCTEAGERKTFVIGRYSRNSAPGFMTLSEAREVAARLSGLLVRGELVASNRAMSPSNPQPPATEFSLGPPTPQPLAPGSAPQSKHDKEFGPTKFVNDDSVPRTSPGSVASDSRQDSARTPSEPRTIAEICEGYVEWMKKNEKSSWKSARSALRCYVVNSHLGNRLARDVTSEDVAELLRQMTNRGIRRTVNRVRSLLSTAFTRAMTGKLDPAASTDAFDPTIKTNPVASVLRVPKFDRPRTRKLDTEELDEFWRRLNEDVEGDGYSLARRALRLDFFLGGQRFKQMARATHTDIDLSAGTILLMDGKGRREQPRPHLLPLTRSARTEVKWLLNFSQSVGSSLLLPGRTSGSELNETTISKFVRDISTAMVAEKKASAPFQFIDIRRTIESTLAPHVLPHIRAQIQSHGISGVQLQHYDLYKYFDEKRAALELWERYLQTSLRRSRSKKAK